MCLVSICGRKKSNTTTQGNLYRFNAICCAINDNAMIAAMKHGGSYSLGPDSICREVQTLDDGDVNFEQSSQTKTKRLQRALLHPVVTNPLNITHTHRNQRS